MGNKICCFTGHRMIAAAEEAGLTKQLNAVLTRVYEDGVREFRAGGARGFDTLAAMAVLSLREQYADVRLCLYLPCPNQTKGWPVKERILFEQIATRANTVQILESVYSAGCMHRRNRALVDGSHCCIAYGKRERGGTAYTLAYARRQGVPVLNLAEASQQCRLPEFIT